ncbi:hypothetical protein Aperf_G00000054815 [Anoplocephala perfoliata]
MFILRLVYSHLATNRVLLVLSTFLILAIVCYHRSLRSKASYGHDYKSHFQWKEWSREECSKFVAKLARNEEFLTPIRLSNKCPKLAPLNDDWRYVGCFYYERVKPPLRLVFYNETERNSIEHCVCKCKWSGLAFAGLAEGSLCYCDRQLPVFMLPSTQCDSISCPADPLKGNCGGKNAIDVYATGIPEDFVPSAPTLAEVPLIVPLNRMASISSDDFDHIRIVYVLVLTSRSWRQVQRMFRLLYHPSNYFYIHVDLKSEYLYSRCRKLAELFPNNVYVTPNRQNPIWGAPSLLDLLLTILQDLFLNFPYWKWDFFINLSETDLPVIPTGKLVQLLDSHRGRIFVKQSGEEIFNYIHSEGLEYAFFQCGGYVWRVGQRPPLNGVVIHGGSDWLVLPRDFAYYSVFSNDNLTRDLRNWFENAILPVESFFHTLAYNSYFCDRIVNANLRLTNWQRPRGCSCKKSSVADWCGCSPSVFSGSQALLGLHETLNTDVNQAAFARKFDSTIDVAMVNYMEERLLGRQLPVDEGAELYLESVFSSEFDREKVSTHVLQGIAELTKMACDFSRRSGVESIFCSGLKSMSTDVFALFNATQSLGNLNYTAMGCQLDRDGFLPTSVIASPLPLRLLYRPDLVLRLSDIEALYKTRNTTLQYWKSPRSLATLDPAEVLYFEVGSNFDAKELVFRNYLRLLPPLNLTSSASPLTVLVLWRDSKEPPTPLTVRIFASGSSSNSSLCSFNLPRNNQKDAPYPGLLGIRASFLELNLTICNLPRHGETSLRMSINESNKRDCMWTNFSDKVDMHELWKVVDICKRNQCGSKIWSPSRVDRKSALGCPDAATGLLHVGKSAVTLLDIAI